MACMSRPRRSESRRTALLGFVLLVCGSLTLLHCDASVDPFETSDQPFSIVGVLDAGQDTQFVRVAAVDDSMAIGAPPEPLDAVVTTEHLASGRTTTWQDSLFQMRRWRSGGVEEERWVHHVWTTETFRPGQTYRFTVTDAKGKTSAATVTLPDTLSEVEIAPPGGFSPRWKVVVQGAERLADVIVILHMRTSTGRERQRTFSVVEDTVRRGPDRFGVEIPTSEINQRVDGELIETEIQIAAAGPDWPDAGSLGEETILTPGIVSNVENGFGYLGGVVSHTMPLQATPSRAEDSP